MISDEHGDDSERKELMVGEKVKPRSRSCLNA